VVKPGIIPYNPKLKARAHELRKHMTLGEVLLWNELKAGKMRGYDFDRQRPIDEYIVDFYCRELQLAVEVDGHSHDYKEDEDANRDRRMKRLGVSVLRFWDSAVRSDMQTVLRSIEAWIRQHEKTGGVNRENPPRPSGTPPKEGISEGTKPTPLGGTPQKEGIRAGKREP
jgi:very-short-patch-repair endonuclease